MRKAERSTSHRGGRYLLMLDQIPDPYGPVANSPHQMEVDKRVKGVLGGSWGWVLVDSQLAARLDPLPQGRAGRGGCSRP